MKKISSIWFLCFFLSLQLIGQSKENSFSVLSGPEKWWVVWHPFKAKKALEVSLRSLEVTDSIKKDGFIGADMNGGGLDAFKHAYWMASLSERIGQSASLKLGKAHEKGNYKSFLKGNPEDGALPDKVSSEMDLFNNKAGAQLSRKQSDTDESVLIEMVLDLLQQGKLRVIKKEGSLFLTCEGIPIAQSSLNGLWENDKCLIPSNQL